MFGHRILASASDSIYRIVFISRLYYVMASGIFRDNSPVALFIGVCKKYGVLGFIKQCILNGVIPSKTEWKRIITDAMRDHEFARWRLEF